VGNSRNVTKELPILIISGAEDPVGDFSKGPAKIQKQLKHAGFQHVTLRLFRLVPIPLICSFNK
jgi:alpha-beta hydrolase superfamily lysophospholipase